MKGFLLLLMGVVITFSCLLLGVGHVVASHSL